MVKQPDDIARNCLISLPHLLTRKVRQLVIHQEGTVKDALQCHGSHPPAPDLRSWSQLSYSLKHTFSASSVKGKPGSSPPQACSKSHTGAEGSLQELSRSSGCSQLDHSKSPGLHHEPPRESYAIETRNLGKIRHLLLERVLFGDLYSPSGSIAYYTLSLSLLFCKVGIHSSFAEQ